MNKSMRSPPLRSGFVKAVDLILIPEGGTAYDSDWAVVFASRVTDFTAATTFDWYVYDARNGCGSPGVRNCAPRLEVRNRVPSPLPLSQR